MNYDQDHIKSLWNKVVNGTATPEERAELRIAVKLYSEDEIDEMIAASDNVPEINTGDSMRGDSNVPSFTEWKSNKVQRNIGRIVKYAGFFVVVAVLIIVTWKISRRPVYETYCTSTPGQELPLRKSSVFITLSDGSVAIVDSSHIGRIVVQGNMEIVRSVEGVIEYRSLANAGENPSIERKMNVFRTAGQQCKVRLPDGSWVRLNAWSSIQVPVSSSIIDRAISMKGEIYLDVIDDPAHPFLIYSENAKGIVSGGRLNVNSFKKGLADITVIQGSVVVRGRDDSVKLVAGQEAVVKVVPRGRHIIKVRDEVDTVQAVAWKSAVQEYSKILLMDFVTQMARLYNLEMRCLENLPRRYVELRYCGDGDVAELFRMFDEMGLRYTVKGKTVVFCEN